MKLQFLYYFYLYFKIKNYGLPLIYQFYFLIRWLFYFCSIIIQKDFNFIFQFQSIQSKFTQIFRWLHFMCFSFNFRIIKSFYYALTHFLIILQSNYYFFLFIYKFLILNLIFLTHNFFKYSRQLDKFLTDVFVNFQFIHLYFKVIFLSDSKNILIFVSIYEFFLKIADFLI